ncbi:Rpl7bp, putative [Babesia ovis]|uniref:Rpl7bp, putative n=1 Tax=Babesia ovis TaxID=5869 RepID=A0A9W5T8L8_BABOV|nr:Rpl7bp, putative [Babesia ovis]
MSSALLSEAIVSLLSSSFVTVSTVLLTLLWSTCVAESASLIWVSAVLVLENVPTALAPTEPITLLFLSFGADIFTTWPWRTVCKESDDAVRLTTVLPLPSSFLLMPLYWALPTITAPGLGESVPLGHKTLPWWVQLERPEEVGDLLELGAACVDLVHNIFHAVDSVLAQVVIDDLVIADAYPAPGTTPTHLGVSPLVEELADGGQTGVTEGHVGGNELQHLDGGLVQLDKDTVVELEQTEQLQDKAWFRGNLVDTLDTHDENHLFVSLLVEGALCLGLAAELNQLALTLDVFLGVVECALLESVKTLTAAFHVLSNLALLELTQLGIAVQLLLEAFIALFLGQASEALDEETLQCHPYRLRMTMTVMKRLARPVE